MRHLVLLRFHEGTEPERVRAIAAALAELPALIPGLEGYRVGADLALAEGTWDFGISADFASEADWAAYQSHPEHQRVIGELIGPVVAERAAVQIAT